MIFHHFWSPGKRHIGVFFSNEMVYIKPSNMKASSETKSDCDDEIVPNTTPVTSVTISKSSDKPNIRVPFTATMQSGFSIGKFPNPRSVVRSYSLGNNKEAQQFLSRGGQVIIRMRGLPYDATPKQVVSTITTIKAL